MRIVMAPSSIDAGPAPVGSPAATTLQDHLRRTLLPAARSTWVDCAQALRHDVQGVTDTARACVLQQAALTLAERGEMLAADYVARVAARLSSDIDPGPPRPSPALDGTPAAPHIALVDEQEYEFSVTVSTTAGHYERRFQNLLGRIERAQNASTPCDAAGQQPAGIYTLLNPFVEQLSDLRLPVSARIRALETFRRHVLEALETIYGAACMRPHAADCATLPSEAPPAAHETQAADRTRPIDLAGWRRLLPT
jgi:hypothetical protein